jgi:hypothetical protein
LWILIEVDRRPQFLIAGILVAYLAAAYALAFAAVRAERRGDSWQLWFSGRTVRPSVDTAVRMLDVRAFRSAASAQFWYEWRCHGPLIMVFMGLEMLMTWLIVLTGRRTIDASLLPLILGLLLLTPIFVVGSVGPVMGRFHPFWVDRRKLNTLVTVRPIASAGLAAAKLRLALLIAVSNWVLCLIGSFAVVLLRSSSGAMILWHRFASLYPGGRAAAICLLACILVPVFMFRTVTDGFALVLTGRKWLADGGVCCYYVLLVSMVSAGIWLVQHPAYFPRVVAIAPWFVAFVAIVKAGAAAAAFRSAIRRKLMGRPAFWRILTIWSACTVAAIALGLLLQPPASLMSKPSLILGAATFVPLIRFPLSTLAVDWNRHR